MKPISVNEELQEHYDTYYELERIGAWRRLGAIDKATNIIALCREYSTDKVVDIGCGDGAVLERLDELGFGQEYYGLEISKGGIKALQDKHIERLVEAKVFDGYSIPYPDKQFDLAILSHVVEHVEHPRQLLYEAARIARHVYVEVPLEHTLRMRKDYQQDPVGHINFYTDKTIRRLLQTCGFKILEQRLADDSYELLKMQHGRQGLIRHLLRRSGLRLIPVLAKYIFVYNSAVLCRSPSEQSASNLV